MKPPSKEIKDWFTSIQSRTIGHTKIECETMKKPINKNKVVVFTGAGISAESGLRTFRDNDGLWDNYPIELVASHRGWEQDPELVLSFYNNRRRECALAKANAAHVALAELEKYSSLKMLTTCMNAPDQVRYFTSMVNSAKHVVR